MYPACEDSPNIRFVRSISSPTGVFSTASASSPKARRASARGVCAGFIPSSRAGEMKEGARAAGTAGWARATGANGAGDSDGAGVSAVGVRERDGAVRLKVTSWGAPPPGKEELSEPFCGPVLTPPASTAPTRDWARAQGEASNRRAARGRGLTPPV